MKLLNLTQEAKARMVKQRFGNSPLIPARYVDNPPAAFASTPAQLVFDAEKIKDRVEGGSTTVYVVDVNERNRAVVFTIRDKDSREVNVIDSMKSIAFEEQPRDIRSGSHQFCAPSCNDVSQKR